MSQNKNKKHNFISRIFFITFLLLSGFVAQPQVSYYKNISPLNGIASATVYDILNDSKGYIWFATDNGVSRYDGFEFVNFTTKNGLPMSSTIALHEDDMGRIWFFSYGGELSYFYNASIIQYECNEQFGNYFLNSYISDIYVTDSGSIWLSPMRGGCFISNPDCNFDIRFNEPLFYGPENYYLYLKDMGDDIFVTLLSDYDADSINNLSFLNNHPDYYVKIKYSNSSFQRRYIKIQDSSYIVTYMNQLFYIEDGSIVKTLEFDKPIINISLDENNNLWVCTLYGGGVKMYQGMDLDKEPKVYFQGKTITHVLQDRESNYWFSTIGDGIYFTTSIGFNIFSPGKGGNRTVINFAIRDSLLYFSTADKKLYKCVVKGDEISYCRQLEYEGFVNWIFDIYPEEDGSLWLAGTNITKYDPNGNPVEPKKVLSAFSFYKSSNDLMYIGRSGLSVYDGNELFFREEDDFHERVFCIGEDVNGLIWLGTLRGLFCYKDSLVEKPVIKNMPDIRITDLGNFREYLLVATSSSGLMLIKDDSVHHCINEDNGLSNNMVKSLVTLGDSVIWLATSDGLNKLTLKEDDLVLENQWISIYDGMPTSAIEKIDYHNGVIWMATERGMLSFYPENVNLKMVSPLISIEKVIVNNNEIPLSDSINLNYDQNNIRIFYKGISFRGPEMVRYRYRLYPDIDEEIITNNRYVDFPGLKPGTYTFNVNAGYINSVWKDNPARLVINIKPHFTSTTWFTLLLLLIGIFVILIFIRLVLKYFKNREENRLRLLRIENRYFRSQLNPHFIFNSLVAIQGFIYKDKKEEAGSYLNKFAKLVRYLMSMNEYEFISLKRELVFINSFLNIQRLRFEDSFDYEVVVDDNIDTDTIMIPPMMAQPFIENAIEHGLQHKEGKGQLKVKFILNNKDLITVIEDNGIGREKSMELNAKHESRSRTHSTIIMRERIKLLSKITGKDIVFEISDQYDDTGNATGTKVIINYPLN